MTQVLISVGHGCTEFHQKLQTKCNGNTANGFWFVVESKKNRYVIHSRQTDVEWAIWNQSLSQNNTKSDLASKLIYFICAVARVFAKGTEFVRMCSHLPPLDHSLPWKGQYCKDFQKLETIAKISRNWKLQWWPGQGMAQCYWVHLSLPKVVEQLRNLYHY